MELYTKHLQLAESARNKCRLVVLSGMSIADLVKPSAWVHMSTSSMIDKGTIVEVLADDMSWYAELLVRSVERGVSVTVAVINGPVVFGANEKIPDGVTIEHRSRSGWCVIKSGKTINSGNDTKESAIAWATSHTL
jgi:hypothetical protein